jgi:hypothetical protein
MTGSGAYTVDGQYNTGVTGQGTQTGTLTFAVPNNAPDTLAYVCQFHSAMGGTINVINNTDQHYVYQTVDNLVSGNEYVLSVYGRFLNRPWIALQSNDGAQAWFNLQTGVTGSFTGSRATITPVSGGWYRCALFYTASSNGAKNQHIHLADANGNYNYTGVATTGSYLWGAQFENGNLLGPYKATTTTGFTTGSMLDQMKFNLKSTASFSLTMGGNMNMGYSGFKGDGTSGYLDTNLASATALNPASINLSVYVRTTVGSGQSLIGARLSAAFNQLLTAGSNNFRVNLNSPSNFDSAANSLTGVVGFALASKTSVNSIKVYRNTTLVTEDTRTTGTGGVNESFAIGSYKSAGVYSTFGRHETSFTTIGDGLTDYEAKALYWIVQKFQTTLGRQVY